MEESPYATPQSEIQSISPGESPYSEKEIEDIGLYFNMVLYFFGSMFLIALLGAEFFAYMVNLAYVAALYFLIKSLRIRRPWLYVVLSLVPFISLITLVVVIRRASSALKNAGKEIGLMGVKGINLTNRSRPTPSARP